MKKLSKKNTKTQNKKTKRVLTRNKITIKTNGKKRKATIPKAVRDKVWDRYIGIEKGISKCICCRTQQIAQNNFECGHVVAEAKGGGVTVANLRPICSLCNRSMGTTQMLQFMRKHGYPLKPEFFGRWSVLKEDYPHHFYFCYECGRIKKPPTSWYKKLFIKCVCGNKPSKIPTTWLGKLTFGIL